MHRHFWEQASAQRGADNARQDVDEKQPVPGISGGDPAANHRANGWRQHGQHAGEHGGDALAGHREQQKDGREDGGYQRTASKPLHDPPSNQDLQVVANRTTQRGYGEHRGGDDKQAAHAEQPCQEPGE